MHPHDQHLAERMLALRCGGPKALAPSEGPQTGLGMELRGHQLAGKGTIGWSRLGKPQELRLHLTLQAARPVEGGQSRPGPRIPGAQSQRLPPSVLAAGKALEGGCAVPEPPE